MTKPRRTSGEHNHLVIACISAALAAQGMAQAELMSDSFRAWADGFFLAWGIPSIWAMTIAMFVPSMWFQQVGLNAWRAAFERGLVRDPVNAAIGFVISFASALVSSAAVLVVFNATMLTQRAVLETMAPVATELAALESDLTGVADAFAGLAAQAKDLVRAETVQGNTCQGQQTDPVAGPRARKRSRDETDLRDMAVTADALAAQGSSIRLRLLTGSPAEAAAAVEHAQGLLRSAGMNGLRRDLQRILAELAVSFVDPDTGLTYVCRTPAFEAKLKQVADNLDRIVAAPLSVPAAIIEEQGWGAGLGAVMADISAWLFGDGPSRTPGLISFYGALFGEVLQVVLLANSVRTRRRLRLLPSEAEIIEDAQKGRRTPQEVADDQMLIKAVQRRMWRQRNTVYAVTSTEPDDVEYRIILHFGQLPAMGGFHDVPMGKLDPAWVEDHSDLWPIGTRFDVYEIPAAALRDFWFRKAPA